jgi:hypothetical protein
VSGSRPQAQRLELGQQLLLSFCAMLLPISARQYCFALSLLSTLAGEAWELSTARKMFAWAEK